MTHSRVGISTQRPLVNCSKNSLGPRRSSQSGSRRRNGSFSLFTAILISSLVLCCFCSGLVTAARGRRRGKAPKEKSAEGAAGGEGESDLLLGQTSSSSKTSEGEDSVATEDEDLLPAGNKEFDGKEVVFDKGSRREAKQFWNVFPG